MRGIVASLACGVALACAGCSDGERARDVRRAAQAIVDELRGQPDADRLVATARFSGGGVSFEHPALLSATHERDEGDDTWTLAYGMFELELYAAEDGISAADYLEELGAYARSDTEMTLITPARPGRSLAVCGTQVTSMLLDVAILGDAHRYESFDLPPDAQGRGRMVTISDDRPGAAPSALQTATERAVLGSLRCDAGTARTAGGR